MKKHIRKHSKHKEKIKETEKDSDYQFNEGRLASDNKWIAAIDTRIKELEEKVGIPELRRLKEKTKYRWRNS